MSLKKWQRKLAKVEDKIAKCERKLAKLRERQEALQTRVTEALGTPAGKAEPLPAGSGRGTEPV
jgi:hypothetical protein